MSEKIKTKAGILACCACALSYLSLTPVIGEMIAAFPSVRESLVQMVITLPTLMFIISSPIAGMLSRKISGRKLLLVSLGLYFGGGMFPFFFHGSIWCLLVGSMVIGLGSGLMMPTINTVICQNFDGPERGQVMGLNSSFAATGAMLFIFVSGQLSRLGWHYSYLSFLLVLPLSLPVLFLGENRASQRTESGGSGFEMNPYIAFLFLVGFLYFIAQNAFNTNSALYISSLGLGGADAASTATLCNTLGGILGGAVFGWLAGKAKDQIATAAMTLAGMGFLMAFFLPERLPILIGGALVGSGFSIYNAAGSLLLSRFVKPENNGFTVSVYMALVNLGGALSPLVVNSAASLLGPGTAVRFLLCGTVILLGAASSLLVNRIHSRRRDPA